MSNPLRGNFGTGVRASISKPTPFIYLAFEKRTHSYTWSSKMLTYSYTALWFFEPIFFAGYYTNITVNSCNTKRISSLQNSLSEKYVHIPGCQKKWSLSHRNPEKSGHSYTFCWKKGANHIPGNAKKGGLFGTHIRTMPYIGSYRPPPPPPPPSRSNHTGS